MLLYQPPNLTSVSPPRKGKHGASRRKSSADVSLLNKDRQGPCFNAPFVSSLESETLHFQNAWFARDTAWPPSLENGCGAESGAKKSHPLKRSLLNRLQLFACSESIGHKRVKIGRRTAAAIRVEIRHLIQSIFTLEARACAADSTCRYVANRLRRGTRVATYQLCLVIPNAIEAS